MKHTKKAIALSAMLSLGAASASATMMVFDGNNGGTAKSGTVATATAANTGNPDRWGPSLQFTGFEVFGGRSVNDNLNNGAFNRARITPFNVDQDLHPNHGGLGVCSENQGCWGSSDSFQSNINNNYKTDEVLFFDFDVATLLDTIWLNGDHNENVNGSLTNNVNNSANALFNIYVSSDGRRYENVFNNQVRPTDLEYISTGLTDSYNYFAIAASGWGQHASYVEAISYSPVPEPATLALFGIGIIGLGLSRRRKA